MATIIESKKTSIQTKQKNLFLLLVQKKMGLIGIIMLTSMLLVTIFAPWIAPYDPYQTIDVTTTDVLAPPSQNHLLGQDEAGKDILSSVLFSSRISIIVGFTASIILIIIGCTAGMTAGYFGGRTDMIIMRITDAILVIPQLPLMLVLIAVGGRGLLNIILVIGFLSWAYMARIVRSQVLTVKERTFVLRARSIGEGHLRIMIYHILPQVLPVIFAQVVLDISFAILTESTLSFLGLGDPTLLSWGSMLNRAYMHGAMTLGAWWYVLPPGIALAWVTLSLCLIGNSVQAIVNPRLKTHHLFDDRKMVAIQSKIIPSQLLPDEQAAINAKGDNK